jgi:hypothetical protein
MLAIVTSWLIPFLQDVLNGRDALLCLLHSGKKSVADIEKIPQPTCAPGAPGDVNGLALLGTANRV